MNKKRLIILVLDVLTIVLVSLITICGVLSFDTSGGYEIINQYGERTKLWGSGIYAHDSAFKAPIFIGSDFTILLCILPVFIRSLWKLYKEDNVEAYIYNFGVMSLLLYYAASIALGVTYNSLHLLYIVLLGTCFFYTAILFLHLYTMGITKGKICEYTITKGMRVFLGIAGVSLFVAWLPDILSSLFGGSSLALIEVYTTEITYVLDMGIISPLIFITLFLVKKKTFIGYALTRMLCMVCIGLGIMLPIQTIFQVASGISIPIPALLTKVLIFMIMALFAGYFEYRLHRDTQYI